MRMRKKPWATKVLETHTRIVRDGAAKKGHWAEYFGNENPIQIEIGCGKGGFIIETARQNPDINYIALERQSSVVAVAVRKAGEGLPNLVFLCDLAEKLSDFFEVGEVKRIYLNFSDPWPKKRYAKRRLTYRGFLQSYREIFGEKGELFFKTDNRDLFEFSLNEFCADDWKLSNITLDLHNSDMEGNIMTEYETRFSEMGMPIYRLEARFDLTK